MDHDLHAWSMRIYEFPITRVEDAVKNLGGGGSAQALNNIQEAIAIL